MLTEVLWTWLPYVLPRVLFFALLYTIYALLFPARAGRTSRVALVDRVVLALRLAVARCLLFLRPFRVTDYSDIQQIRFNPQVIKPEDVIRSFVPPHSVLYFSGFAASESPCVWSHAIRQLAIAAPGGHVVSQVTIVTQSGSSLRGVGSTSIDNVITDTPPGTVKRLIAGHLETCVGTLKKLDAEQRRRQPKSGSAVELYNIPLGVISRLVGLQADSGGSREAASVATAIQRDGLAAVSETLHPCTLETTVGVGSFLERTRGVLLRGAESTFPHLVSVLRRKREAAGDDEVDALVYGLPPITVALVHARFADQDGNAHFEESTVVGDAIAAAKAAYANGGRVLVSVQEIRYIDHAAMRDFDKNPLILPARMVTAISCARSVLTHDFSGLARHCRRLNEKSKKALDREELFELWERASVGYALATTFHRRWRDCNRDAPVVMHAHDEVLRLAKVLTQWKRVPVVRVLIGVSLPELVAMRLAESGSCVFLGGDVSDNELARMSPFALRDEHAVEQRLMREREAIILEQKLHKQQRGDTAASAAAAAEDGALAPCLQFVLESGVVGGLPAPGFLFGTAFHPHRIMQGPDLWRMFAAGNTSRSGDSAAAATATPFIHMCVLGAGEVDVSGCVNVSRGSDRLRDVIGVGGYADIVDGTAYAIVVVVSLSSCGSRFSRPHGSSIVQRVNEVTFDPLHALRRGVSVRYCTEFGVFHAELCEGGMSARLVAPRGLELLVQERCKVQLIFAGADRRDG